MATNNQPLTSQADLEQRLLEAIDACNAARQREAAAEQRYHRASRRARLLGGFGLALIVGTLSLSTLKPVGAQGGSNPTFAQLVSRVINLETKTQFMTANKEKQSTWFTGCNVYVQSGSGRTDDNALYGGSLTGLGNLIVGYNQPSGFSGYDVRTGSHNLILGDQNNYSSYGGLIAGFFNTISGPYASVSGGSINAASGPVASVSGGASNTASSPYALVSGGQNNTASGYAASVSGGNNNIASATDASVSGGQYNAASGYYSSVSGGASNTTSGSYTSVSGGQNNTASGTYASVSGGYFNRSVMDFASILGGYGGYAYGSYSVICGGLFNAAGGDYSTVLGGNAILVTTTYGHNP